ncbi:hypothetical protein GGR57DRAFT_451093 [Xylariaceae sp. FL1272]|nr:hypothetical protein GGR57DRAFT_451093 [Xylariaceae sp. FL1272]
MVGPRGGKLPKSSREVVTTPANGKPVASSKAGAVKNQVQGRTSRGNIATKQSNQNQGSAGTSRVPAAKMSDKTPSSQLDQSARVTTSDLTNQANPKANASRARVPKASFFAGHDDGNSDARSQPHPPRSKKTQDALSNGPKKRAATITTRSNAKKQRMNATHNSSSGGNLGESSSTVRREKNPEGASSEDVSALNEIRAQDDDDEQNSHGNLGTSAPEDMLAGLRRKTDRAKSSKPKQVKKQPLSEDQQGGFRTSIKTGTKPMTYGTRSKDVAAENVASALISSPQVAVGTDLSGKSQHRTCPQSQNMENLLPEAEVIRHKQSLCKSPNDNQNAMKETATTFQAELSCLSDGVEIPDDSFTHPGPKQHAGSLASPPQSLRAPVSGQVETKSFTLVSDDASHKLLPTVVDSRDRRAEIDQQFTRSPGSQPTFDWVPQYSSSKALQSEQKPEQPQHTTQSIGAMLDRSARAESATASDRHVNSASDNHSQRRDYALGRKEDETSTHHSRFQSDDIYRPINPTSISRQSRDERNVSPLYSIGSTRGFQSQSDMNLSLNPKSVEFARKMSQRPDAIDSNHVKTRHGQDCQDRAPVNEKSGFSSEAQIRNLAEPNELEEECMEIKGAREIVYQVMGEAMTDAFKHLESKEADLDAITRSFQRNVPRMFDHILTRQQRELNTCVSQFNANCREKQVMYKGAMEYVESLQHNADHDKDPIAMWKKMAAEEEIALRKYNKEISRL